MQTFHIISEEFEKRWDTLSGERLKSLMETGVHVAALTDLGTKALHLASGGTRIVDERLSSTVCGIEFENPVMVGAGWDKKGRAVDGLYELGFAGTEVGTVLQHLQVGPRKPRLWTDNTHSVGLNRMGLNSPGVATVSKNLHFQRRNGVVGISLGMNKTTAEDDAPWSHAQVAEQLHPLADYFVINVSTPNTPGRRDMLRREPLTDIVKEVRQVINQQGYKPLFIKSMIDLNQAELDDVLEVCLAESVDGVIDTNTTIDPSIKSNYGWADMPGGLSGNDPDYRRRAVEQMRYITRVTRGTGLSRIGVGGIHDAYSAIQRIKAGAQVVQVVTGIRQHGARTAREINQGLITIMDRDGVENISEYVGTTA